jgi:hypothetical protein
MTEANVSFAGNLTDDPELRHTEGGIARAMFRVAVSARKDQKASFFTVIVWRDQAEHASESLSKSSRVVVVGRLQQRSWTAEDGSASSTSAAGERDAGERAACQRSAPPFLILRVSREEFLYELKAGPAGGEPTWAGGRQKPHG